MSLTTAQRAAVETEARNVLVVGSAGSRKTTTLVARIGALVTRGVKPSRVACITYTNAAARVLEDRLGAEFNPPPRLGYLGTLHGFCLRHLQHFVYPNVELRVIDDNERNARLLRATQAAGVRATIRELLDYKTRTLATGALRVGTPVHIAVMKYQTDTLFEGLLDYEMILGLAFHSLHSGCERWRWEHLLVDEYQDASALDAQILAEMAADNRFYVGDPLQAIFAFRGGDVDEFYGLMKALLWEKHYLTENWRSTPEICAAASRLSANATDGPALAMTSRLPSGPPPFLTGYHNAADEALDVANWLRASVEAGRPPESMAVLARTNEIALNVGGMLRHVGLETSYLIERTRPPDWTTALAALEVLARPTSVQALIRWARINDPEYDKFFRDMATTGDQLKTFALRTRVPITGDADKMADELAALGISIESIATIVQRFNELPDTASLGDLALELALGGPGRKIIGEGVFVGTIHGAKGMEFETVALVGAEDEIMPGTRKRANIDEERRVFYVGMTRARRRLLITWAASRTLPHGGWMKRSPSRFIAEALTDETL